MKQGEPAWVVIHMAHSEKRACAAVDALTREGFLVKSRTVSRALSAGDNCFEVLALKSEAKEARDLLQEMGY